MVGICGRYCHYHNWFIKCYEDKRGVLVLHREVRLDGRDHGDGRRVHADRVQSDCRMKNVLADKFPVRIGHELYSLYVHSYLDYGQNRVVQKIRTILEREQRGVSEINNPCMMRGNRLFESLTA